MEIHLSDDTHHVCKIVQPKKKKKKKRENEKKVFNRLNPNLRGRRTDPPGWTGEDFLDLGKLGSSDDSTIQ